MRSAIPTIAIFFLISAFTPALAREDSPSVPMVSGGVGDDDYDAIQSNKELFNVRILFTEEKGAYLSDLTVSISRPGGTQIASTVTQGPVLFLKLSPGIYIVKAAVSGVGKEQKITVAPKGRTNVHMMFPLSDNID